MIYAVMGSPLDDRVSSNPIFQWTITQYGAVAVSTKVPTGGYGGPVTVRRAVRDISVEVDFAMHV